MKQKILSLALAAVMTATMAGCSHSADQDAAINTLKPQTTSSAPAQKGTALSSISLAADAKDSFNPYQAKTTANYTVFPLLYDSLYRLDSKFNPEPLLAKSAASTADCSAWEVTLKDGVAFSDGSALTAQSVVYSVNQAKSSSLYGARLKNVASVAAKGDKVVRFNLASPDRNFLNCLDVPIVKDGTAKEKSSAPVGAGRYVLKIDSSKKNYSLSYNKKWHGGKQPKFTDIPLVDPPEDEAIMTSVKTGNVALIFSDLSKGEIGGIGAASKSVPLNNMIYIGINSSRGVLKDPEFRSALSFAIDRKALLSKGYSGRGMAAYLPLNPLFQTGETLTGDGFPGYSLQKADSLFDGLGYDKTDMSGLRLNGKTSITLNLLVSPDNNYKTLTANAIKSALKEAGIGINIVEAASFSEFTKAVANKNFDLYLGETKLLNNMDISGFFSSAPLNAGISASKELTAAYSAYRNKSGGYGGFAKLFAQETPFIPLLFRSGIAAYNQGLQTEIIATPSDVFYNIIDWK